MHESAGYNYVYEMINSGINSCAIFAVNDSVAVGATKNKELKIKIPKKIGIVGISNNPISEIISLSLTTIDQHSFEMGKKATEILIDEIEGRNKMGLELDFKLETKLIRRESI